VKVVIVEGVCRWVHLQADEGRHRESACFFTLIFPVPMSDPGRTRVKTWRRGIESFDPPRDTQHDPKDIPWVLAL
jgi:hypothetical protein